MQARTTQVGSLKYETAVLLSVMAMTLAVLLWRPVALLVAFRWWFVAVVPFAAVTACALLENAKQFRVAGKEIRIMLHLRQCI